MSPVGLSACIFLVLLYNPAALLLTSKAAAAILAALKRLPLLSLTVSKSVHPCTLLDDEFANANSLLLGTTDIRVRSKMYILVHFWTRVFAVAKTSLLFGTTAIRGGVARPFANRRSRC